MTEENLIVMCVSSNKQDCRLRENFDIMSELFKGILGKNHHTLTHAHTHTLTLTQTTFKARVFRKDRGHNVNLFHCIRLAIKYKHPHRATVWYCK